ncbi:hypothetical protein B0H13DRAFT_2375720 [Mycena leptocephala]|nr:hypothetical protein B0H13DRAFT_2375720 [Mycena leptocephala]
MPNTRPYVRVSRDDQHSIFLRGRLYPAVGRRCNVSIHSITGIHGYCYPYVESVMDDAHIQPYIHDTVVQVVRYRLSGAIHYNSGAFSSATTSFLTTTLSTCKETWL